MNNASVKGVSVPNKTILKGKITDNASGRSRIYKTVSINVPHITALNSILPGNSHANKASAAKQLHKR